MSDLFNLERLRQNPISGLFAEFHLNMDIPLTKSWWKFIKMYDFKEKF